MEYNIMKLKCVTLCLAAALLLAACGGSSSGKAENPVGPGPTPPPATDTAAPTVTAFTATGTSSPVTISGFTASDNVAVTRYLITESNARPAASSASWQAIAPTSYATFSSGNVTLYPWAKDAAGNVSAAYGSPVTRTLTAQVFSAKMGTNLNWMADWDPEKLPADLMWSARAWATVDGNGYNHGNWAPTDSHGWPIVSVGTTFGAIFEAAPWVGTYKLSFTNRQGTVGDTVSNRGGNITLTNRQHNIGTNVTTYDVNVPSYSAGQFIWLMWTGTTGGVTDVHLMRPLKDGSGWHAIGTPLSDYIIDRLAHFSTIRTMQTSGGANLSSGSDTVWSGRTKPWSYQGPTDADRPGGVAIENLIAMANQANKDLWVTIPFRADDNYIRKMAQVMRYGSDGITPYTSDQTSPVFAPLKPTLNLYVEHGNEIWNGGYGYWANENYDLNNAEIAAGDPHHTTYRSSDSLTWGYSWRRTGWLAVRQSLIFREVFGDAAMMTRVRPILATQHVRFATTDEPLYYVRDVWGHGYNSSVAYGSDNQYGNVAHPVNYYIYALATAAYFPDDNSRLNDVSSATAMIDSVVTALNNTAADSLLPAMTWNSNIATSLGLKYVAYEGGANLISQLMPAGATVANARLANYDPVQGAHMGANIDAGTGLPLADQSNYLYGRAFSEWAKAGGGLFMHFTLGSGAGGGGMFGLCPPSAESDSDPRLETGPKWEAVKAYGKAWGQ